MIVFYILVQSNVPAAKFLNPFAVLVAANALQINIKLLVLMTIWYRISAKAMLRKYISLLRV